MIVYIMTPVLMFMELILLDILADTFLEKKKMGSWRNRVLGLLILTAIMSCYVMLFEKIVILKLFFDFLLVCAYLMCFYQTTLKEVFFIYVFQYSVVSCIDCSALLGYNYVYGNSGNIVVYYLMCLLVRVTELGIGFLIRWFWRRSGEAALGSEGRRVSFPPFVIVIGAGIFATQFLMRTQIVPVRMPLLMNGIIGLNTFLFFYMLISAKTESEKSRLRDAARQTKMELLIYQNKQELYTKQGKRLHEYKNQLLTISHMLEQGEVSQTLDYVQGLTGEIAKELERIYTGHPTVDAILNMKRQEALNRGIHINFMCSDLKDVRLTEEEIIILLGNLLDNAMEAAEACESGRNIQVRMVREERQMVITVKNPCDKQPLWEEGRIVTSKPDGENHGFGLEIVQDIVERYDGSFAIRAEGDYVTASVLIPEP